MPVLDNNTVSSSLIGSVLKDMGFDDEDDTDMYDGEEDEDARLEAREKALGFKPQKEILCNRLLPYSEKLDSESCQLFATIKTNLAKTICLRELRPGFVMWTSRLNKFLKMYGFKFSKEDHVMLIKLHLSVIHIPDLEPWLVNKTAGIIVSLMKRKELLDRSDLQIEWRPLYQLFDRLMYSSYEALGMISLPPSLDMSLKSLIRCCRTYFADTATQEMLDEWRPLMCPFDVTMGKAMCYFEMFLPTFDCFDKREKTYQLWFNEFMSFWSTCSNGPPWEPNVFSLYARLADHNIGRIDWEPYIPAFFTRIQKSFNLPVRYKKISVTSKLQPLDPGHLSRWIVATYGNGSSTKKFLDQQFKALESYYHPANFGGHALKLMAFLMRITQTFVRRVHRERYAKPKWGTEVANECKLTDEDIEGFVRSILPVILNAMYSNAMMSTGPIQHLASLAPNIVIPPLIERIYAAYETLTEPNKLLASLNSVVSVARSLVYPGPSYKDGPTHVIPLLIMSLPGIDPNDIRKSALTFQMISTFCTLIPIVDSSSSITIGGINNDLTEEEKTICSQSAQFEDFVVEFLDKCFNLIESSTQEHTREEMSSSDHQSNKEDKMKNSGMASTFSSIITHASSSIQDIALRKVEKFINGRILETKVSGKLAASLCRCLVRVAPEKSLKAFIPNAIRTIQGHFANGLIEKDEMLDEEVKFNLLLLSECVRCIGTYLLPYLDDIKKVLRKTLHLSNKDGYTLACYVLRHVLRSLTIIAPTDYKSSPKGYDLPLTEYQPFREWGKPSTPNHLNLTWHLPNDEERKEAQHLIDEFLVEELHQLEMYSKQLIDFDKKDDLMSKDKLKNRLVVVQNILQGAGCALPFWSQNDVSIKTTEDHMPFLVDSATDITPLKYMIHPASENYCLAIGGDKNVRLEIIRVMDLLQSSILSNRVDDTKSLLAVIHTYEMVLLFGGITKQELDNNWRSFNFVKKIMENRLIGGRKHIRPIHIDRAFLQHESRVLEKCHTSLTTVHVQVYNNLLSLATSHYSSVRSQAQSTLFKCTQNFAYSYKILMPTLINSLQQNEETVSHEQFKGSLYVLLGSKHERTLLVKPCWQTLSELYPALVGSRHSEKPSISKLMDKIMSSIHHHFDTFTLTLNIPNNVIEMGKSVYDSRTQRLLEQCPDDVTIENRKQKLDEENENNVSNYHKLLDALSTLIAAEEEHQRDLHWRKNELALTMICRLARHDYPLPPKIVRIIVGNLIHENLTVRKNAISLMGAILKQQKRSHAKIALKNDFYPVIETECSTFMPVIPGDRDDNQWVCYDSQELPRNEMDWDKPRFVHKTHYGFYTWPKNMEVYAPSNQQPKLDRPESELNEIEKEIYNFFNNQKNVDKLIEFLSLEENKGRDKFNAARFIMFKGLFRNFGPSLLPNFEAHLKRMVQDENDSLQRCAAEIISGVIRGAKHWDFSSTERIFKDILVPLIRLGLANVSVEAIGDWGTCFATASDSRDPNRIHWIMDVLMEEPIRSKGSFIDSSRLYALQGGMAQQEWRVGELCHRLNDFLKPYLTHPFKNVRDRLGSVLANIYMSDLDFIHVKGIENNDPSLNTRVQSNKRNPKVVDFINEVLPQLEIMSQEPEETVAAVKSSNSLQNGASETPLSNEVVEMLKTVALQNGQLPSTGGHMVNIPPEQITKMFKTKMVEEMSKTAAFVGRPDTGDMQIPGHGNVDLPVEMQKMLPYIDRSGNLPGGFSVDGKVSEELGKRQIAIRLLQTVAKFLAGILTRAFNGPRPEYFKLLPMLCANESNDFEPNLARDCAVTLAYLAQVIVPIEVIPSCLDAIEQIVDNSTSWKSKAAVLELLQVIVFSNMPSIISKDQWPRQVVELVQKGLKDNSVEVREKSSQVLSGLLHCAFIDEDVRSDILKKFYARILKNKASKKLGKRSKLSTEGADESKQSSLTTINDDKLTKNMVLRHSGVLGLCAFVNAYPYDIPEFIPDILMFLSGYIHEVQPISTTIKKTLQDFKRTHQDNWQDHKLKFSEDQLAVLTDILVSPSYYA